MSLPGVSPSPARQLASVAQAASRARVFSLSVCDESFVRIADSRDHSFGNLLTLDGSQGGGKRTDENLTCFRSAPGRRARQRDRVLRRPRSYPSSERRNRGGYGRPDRGGRFSVQPCRRSCSRRRAGIHRRQVPSARASLETRRCTTGLVITAETWQRPAMDCRRRVEGIVRRRYVRPPAEVVLRRSDRRRRGHRLPSLTTNATWWRDCRRRPNRAEGGVNSDQSLAGIAGIQPRSAEAKDAQQSGAREWWQEL